MIPEQLKMKSSVRMNRLICSNQAATIIKESLPPSLDRAMELAQGASIRLPIKEFGFSLQKRAFLDALALRYNWLPSMLLTNCACGRLGRPNN